MVDFFYRFRRVEQCDFIGFVIRDFSLFSGFLIEV